MNTIINYKLIFVERVILFARANVFPTITNCLLKKKLSTSVNMTSKIMDKFKLPSRHEPGVYNVW
jgi:hypothetical protein